MKSIAAIAVLSAISIVTWGCGNKNNDVKQANDTKNAGREVAAEKSVGKSGQQLCAVHNAPKDQCFICDSSLRDPKRLWCKEHARYEDRCWLCHPELQDKARLYCNEHGLYEDECFLCRPGIERSALEPEGAKETGHAESGQGTRLMCNEHGVYEDECGSCHPELVEALEPGKSMKVRFASKESAGKAGVTVGTTREINASIGRMYPCKVTFNKDQFAEVVARSPGIVSRVLVKQGEKVRSGQILAQLHSSALGDAQGEYLTAFTQTALKRTIYQREHSLYQEDVVSDQVQAQANADYSSAKQQLEAARQRLINMGFTLVEISDLGKNPGATPILNVRAPFSGTIIDREAVAGQSVETASMLFSISNLSSMWIEMAVPAGDASVFSLDDSVITRFKELTDIECGGKITWISPSVDAKTRTVTVRALANNASGSLRDAMFGEAAVLTASSGNTNVGVPETALQRISGKDYVFVKNDEDLFEIRRVVTGGKSDKIVGIQNGLSGNEQIVVAGSFIVRSELQKARLGAGCTDH